MGDTCDGTTEILGCGAQIEWVVVAKSGKRMPIDVEPVAVGNLIKLPYAGENGVTLVAYVRSDTDAALFDDPPRFVSHFSTCPHAEAFRKKKPKGAKHYG